MSSTARAVNSRCPKNQRLPGATGDPLFLLKTSNGWLAGGNGGTFGVYYREVAVNAGCGDIDDSAGGNGEKEIVQEGLCRLIHRRNRVGDDGPDRKCGGIEPGDS